MSFLTRRTAIDGDVGHTAGSGLRATLGWPHLVALGVGAIVGTGIYTLTGEAAGLAGPGAMLAFLIAGAVCAAAALCYAEMATLMPRAGSAYTYSYAVMGETTAWVVGWSLILEYTVVCAAVAVGWAGYASGLILQYWPDAPKALMAGPHAGGIINLPAVFIAMIVAGLLALGTRESARVNFVLVIVKLIALAGFIALALPAFNGAHFTPFMPHGFWPHEVDGVKMGVMAAAAIIFFAFYGFDAISTASEETKNPARDLTIGIVGSMVLCTLIYMGVAAAAIGAMLPADFAKSPEPLAHIIRELGHPTAAQLIGLAAVIAMPTVIMVFMFGQTRVFFAMARDGLLPKALSRVNAKTGTPVLVTLFTGLIASILGGLLPLGEIVSLANAGTLAAFIATALSMMILRRKEPARPRRFKTPLWFITGPFAILGCLYLFAGLPSKTWLFFLIWNAIGLLVYLAYGRTKSNLAKS
ncbi:amino acid permease [Caulobacter mirabilis]|uniref:Amino acid permease n=1 Tax=Caulobacter mirabilis TaxID=69666 RepID=A0A2D2B2S4_9CAUL|nr:amino acid permease [Caulobacter mirabilis]ATQ44540.1 amino acid permease [Caulobacter mirabilis]